MLLDPRWSSSSAYPSYIEENAVACLAHYSLENNKKVRGLGESNYINIKEIVEVLREEDQTGTILLVDGYDKIAHLIGSRSISDNILAILDFPNVVMAVRDGSVISLIRGSFDSHLILKGISSEGIELLINQHFKVKYEGLKSVIDSFFAEDMDSKSIKSLINKLNPNLPDSGKNPVACELDRIFRENLDIDNQEQVILKIDKYYKSIIVAIIDFVKHNQVVQELLYTPMHATMICEVYTDVDYQGRLSSALTLDELYNELMNKIGKNFIERMPTEDSYDNLREFKILKQLAYQGLTYEIFAGKEVNKVAVKNGSNIDKLFSLGLLKIVGSYVE